MWLSLYVTVPYSSSLHLSSSLYILLFLPTVTPMSDCIWWAARLHSEIFPHRQCRCLGCLDPGSPPRAPFLSGNIRKHILWRSLKHFENFWSIWESDRSKAALLLSERPSMAGNPQCSSSDEISISFENGINTTHLVFYMSYIDIDAPRPMLDKAVPSQAAPSQADPLPAVPPPLLFRLVAVAPRKNSDDLLMAPCCKCQQWRAMIQEPAQNTNVIKKGSQNPNSMEVLPNASRAKHLACWITVVVLSCIRVAAMHRRLVCLSNIWNIRGFVLIKHALSMSWRLCFCALTATLTRHNHRPRVQCNLM